MSYQNSDLDDLKISNSNNIGPKDIFKLRKAYDEAYPDAVPPYDFNNGKNMFYGRIDRDNNTVHVNESYLKEIGSTSRDSVMCLNFVADAFVDFKRFIRINYASKFVPDSFVTTNWQARRGWQSPHILYQKKMDDLYQVFVKGNLSLKMNEKKISNIHKFIEVFFDDFYPSIQDTIPITKSGVIMSKYYNPSSTGLCVEVVRQNFSLEFVKFQNFVKSPNFKVYALVAAKFGFLIDKNAPWRLVANINSPAMKEYMNNYGLHTGNLFDTCFVKTFQYDIQNLKVYLKQMYAAFTSLSPTYMKECPNHNVVVKREKVNSQEYDKFYDDLFWLRTYYRIKLNEVGIRLPKAALKIEMRNVENSYKYIDSDQGSCYDDLSKRIFGGSKLESVFSLTKGEYKYTLGRPQFVNSICYINERIKSQLS